MTMPTIGTAQAWRDAARKLMAANVPPSEVSWGGEDTPPGLWDTPPPVGQNGTLTVPRSFLSLANSVVWHSDPARFSLLYRMLWRLRETPHLMTDRADADLAVLRRMEKNVHRCQHKMKAFVRFRDIGEPGDARRSFAAWFEPTYHTVEPTAPFFARRFGDMDWQIVTPHVSACFIDRQLTFGKGQTKPTLPEDSNEQLWTTYFRNIFNPARLKVKAMQSEMPKKYWKNIPEAAAIPDMIASAPARQREMERAAPTIPPLRAAKVQNQLATIGSAWSGSSEALNSAIANCTRCPIHCNATQAVLGEGPRDASMMIIGEQPGDREDLEGRPFVGPTGQLLNQLLKKASVERDRVYVTNAVKHFKFKPLGRRRLHERPNASEVMHCKWWLDAERGIIKPKVILAMGSTAALALTGDGRELTNRRGVAKLLDSETKIILTFHPSYLLRIEDPAKRAAAADHVHHDLLLAKRICHRSDQIGFDSAGITPDEAYD